MAKRKTWAFASLTGPVAWTLHLLAIYVIGEFFCVMDGTAFVFLGLSATQWSVATTTLVFVIVLLWATGVAWRHRRYLHSYPDSGAYRGASFLMSTGILSNLFFIAVILFETVPVFFLGGEC